jgi:HPt (histidine-containing phosphotransfer) domain-containing protein
MIDWKRIDELRGEVGPEDFDEVVELFLEEVEDVIARLRDAPALNGLEGDLHFLKGSALSLGFSAFSALCEHGERLSASGQPGDVDLTAIVTCFEQSRTAFLEQLPLHVAA